MGDIINLAPRGTSLETLKRAAEEVGAEPDLRVIVVLVGEDASEVYPLYSDGCDPMTVHYALSCVMSYQLRDDEE
jgi:hypothetical protein